MRQGVGGMTSVLGCGKNVLVSLLGTHMSFVLLLLDLQMPLGLLGGASLYYTEDGRDKLWAIGGGNGSALPFTFVKD